MNKSERQTFSENIEKEAKASNITHIEAIISHCERTGLELEMVNKLVTNQLKVKIEVEAKELRFIK